MSDIESVRVPAAQLALLQPYRVHHVLERHGQAREVARHLFYKQLLSFDPDEVLWLTPAQEAELDFLCGVAKRIGLRGIEGVLVGLTAPFAFPLAAVTYDFSEGRWCLRRDEEEVSHAA
jgi:hypothetical protein